MKKSIITLSLLSVFALTACGGGGSSTGIHKKTVGSKPINQTIEDSTKKPNPPSTKKDNTKEDKKQDKPDIISGNYLVGASRNNVGYTSFSLRGKDLNYIEMFGNKIPLSDPAAKPVDGWNHIGNGLVSSSEQLQYARHGAFQHGSEVYIFAQGEKAQSVPSTGKFTYEGHATLITVEGKDVFKDLKEGETKLLVRPTTSTFEIDFGKKSLVGSIGVGSGYNILLQANIDGVTFRRFGALRDYNVTGEFYGKNGEELAGTYSLDDKVSGTFGAKQVNKSSENKSSQP